jgi:DnaJ like chaperone protein
MGWVGKFLGGTIGFALGGPLGAIAGAAFGHLYDQAAEEVGTDRAPLSRVEGAQMTFFVAVFSMLAKLARADGRISDEEIQTIERFMEEELRLSDQSRQLAIRIFRAAKASPDTFQDYAQQFYLHFRYYPQLLEFMMDILFRLAASDGRMSSPEESLLRSAARIFHLGESVYERFKLRYFGRDLSHYEILGCSPEDSDDTIKGRYRKLVMEFHPDRIAAKGLPEEFAKVAEERFREIQTAYEAVKRERGMP